jgi:hypothetical protein
MILTRAAGYDQNRENSDNNIDVKIHKVIEWPSLDLLHPGKFKMFVGAYSIVWSTF